MQITAIAGENGVIAQVHSDEVLVQDGQSALDLMMTAQYETGCTALVLGKEALAEEFFKLASGLAGEVLQKFVNYHIRLAIYGDYSGYNSKALRDFIYESNRGNAVYFAGSLEEAVAAVGGQG